MEWFGENLSERILKMEKEDEEEEERSAEDVDLDFLYASIIHAVVGGSEQLTLRSTYVCHGSN
jgi:hypothetical protein